MLQANIKQVLESKNGHVPRFSQAAVAPEQRVFNIADDRAFLAELLPFEANAGANRVVALERYAAHFVGPDITRDLPRVYSEQHARIVTVTPELAERWLALSWWNRRIKALRIKQFGECMKRGEWALNGQPVNFDWWGRLANAHHRLRACIQVNAPFPTWVMWGIDPRSIDRGVARSNRDEDTFNGISRPKAYYPIVRGILSLEDGGGRKTNITWSPPKTDGQIEECAARNDEAIKWLDSVYSQRFIAPIWAALCFCYPGDRESTTAFAEAIVSQANLSVGSGAWLLSRTYGQAATKRQTAGADNQRMWAMKTMAALYKDIHGERASCLQESAEAYRHFVSQRRLAGL